jgi:hypothetical protein
VYDARHVGKRRDRLDRAPGGDELGRRTEQACVRREAAGYQRRAVRARTAQRSNRDVDPIGQEVDDVILEADLDPQPWMLLEQRGKQRRESVDPERHGRAHHDMPGYARSWPDNLSRLLDAREDHPCASDKLGASLGQIEPMRGPSHQWHTELLLQPS